MPVHEGDALEEARLARPHVKLALDVFRTHAATFEGVPMHPADLFLACACGHGDPEAIRELDTRYLRTLDRHVSRYGTSPEFAGDVQQALRERLLVADGVRAPKILEYAGRGPLEGWLRVCAVRVALNMRKSAAERALPSARDAYQVLQAADDPEVALLRARYGPQFQEALRVALVTLPSRDRTLLRLHFLEAMTIDALGTIYEVHRATAARWIIAARERLLALAVERVGERVGGTPSELASIYRALQSHLELTFSGAEREEADARVK